MTQWVKGQSGNANGRPRGAESNSSHIRKLLQARSEEIINKVVELSLEGDITALKICIDRICPSLKNTDETIHIQPPADANLSQIGHYVLKALADGELSPNEASSVLGTFIKQSDLHRLTIIEEKRKKLEEKFKL